MRHIILAALSATAALTVAVAPHGTDTGLYTFGATAAFSAGMFYAQSKGLEKHTGDLFAQVREQIQNIGRAVQSLASRFGCLRTSFETWRARVELVLESQDGRIEALERRGLEAA